MTIRPSVAYSTFDRIVIGDFICHLLALYPYYIFMKHVDIRIFPHTSEVLRDFQHILFTHKRGGGELNAYSD
jgi:hypothetical protein